MTAESGHRWRPGEGRCLPCASHPQLWSLLKCDLACSATTSCLGCELLGVRESSRLIFLSCKSSWVMVGGLWSDWLVDALAALF